MKPTRWSDPAARRGAGFRSFEPPGDMRGQELWHRIDTHLGARVLQWRPTIQVWRGVGGERWTAEFAGQLGWFYRGLADPPPPPGRT